MAYVTYYTIESTNNLKQEVLVLIQKKDGDVDTVVQNYKAREIKRLTNTQDRGVFATIISQELTITINMAENDIDCWDEFIDAQKDTFRVIATINDQYVFHGYVLPDEGAVPFQDKPIDYTIKAIDGLGLLKQTPLTKIDGTNFDGEHLWVEYIAAALNPTGLDLPIRIYDDVYHSSMLNRDDDFKWDCFGQAKLEYRTFLKDAVDFVDCYQALKIILNRSHRLFYWNGQIVIFRLSLYQYVPFVLYYTLYDANGENAVGYWDAENYATVGKTEIIRAINKDQVQSSAFADKSVKTLFNYNIWPELPKNNKFERGTAIGSGTAYDELDVDGDGNITEEIGTYINYTIDDWPHGLANRTDPENISFTTGATPYTRRVKNIYDVEISREIVIVTPAVEQTEYWLRSEAIPVVEGGKITFGIEKRFLVDISTTEGVNDNCAVIYLKSNTTSAYYHLTLGSDGLTRWMSVPFNQFLSVGYVPIKYSSDSRKYQSVSIESPPIPINGTITIALVAFGGSHLGTLQYFRNLSFEYKPYVIGGFKLVSADYWTRSQTKSFPDKSEEEIFLSDNPHKIFKGCILDGDGIPTSPDWYRHGITESRHYKELVNIAEYNLLCRRFLNLEGTWRGTTFAPNNNQTNAQPIGFHKVYRQVDYAAENRQFILSCPFEMDLLTGQIRASFAEVLKAGTEYTEIVQTINIFRGIIVSAINNTTEAEWDSEGNAPSPTIGFPPVAYVYPDNDWIIGEPRSIGLVTNVADEFIVTGTGITEIFNEVIDQDVDYRLQVFQFADAELLPGAIYTFSVYGHVVSVTVGTIQITDQDDGKLLGDSSEFKYQF